MGVKGGSIMSRTLIVLTLSAIVGSALPALAGPSGSSVPSYFPMYPQLNAPRDGRPYGLLGDTDRTDVRTRSDLRETQPATGWQRRPSEAK
jgi:hypothetical protein